MLRTISYNCKNLTEYLRLTEQNRKDKCNERMKDPLEKLKIQKVKIFFRKDILIKLKVRVWNLKILEKE